MIFYKEINHYRRKITKTLVSYLMVERNVFDKSIKNKDQINKILVVRPNHRLGNQLLVTPLVVELQNTFPNAEIVLFLKGNLGEIIFKEYRKVKIISLPKRHFKEINKYIYSWYKIFSDRYDLVINVVENSSSGKLASSIVNSKNKIIINSL